MVLAGGFSKVILQALATACGPVSDSVSTELRYITLHAEIRQKQNIVVLFVTNCAPIKQNKPSYHYNI